MPCYLVQQCINTWIGFLQVKGLPANQGMLYKQALEDQFRHVGFNPEAVFEETRSALIDYQEVMYKMLHGCSIFKSIHMLHLADIYHMYC